MAAAVAALLVGGAVVVLGSDPGPQPPFIGQTRGGSSSSSPASRTQGPLALAGSGSSIPITRALVGAYAASGGPLPVVHPSIGSSGGIRALLDGVVDIALVSRPLNERERALGLVAVPCARVPIIVAVHADVPDVGITMPQLVAVFAGHRRVWSDGSRITVLQRERGDSSHRAVAAVVAGFAETNDDGYAEGRWRVLYHDDAMTDALDSTPGAVGLFGQGAVPEPRSIRALAVEGVVPSPASIAEHRYPFTKDLTLVTLSQPTGRVAAFVEYVRSPAGREVIQRGGGLPLPFGSSPRAEAP